MDLEIIERFYCLSYKIDPITIHNFHTFIMEKKYKHNLIELIDDCLYVSNVMDDTNITNIYKSVNKIDLMKIWKNNIKKMLL